MPDIHIIPDGEPLEGQAGEWWCRVQPRHPVRGQDRREGWLGDHGGGEVFTYRDEGEFARIRKGDAV